MIEVPDGWLVVGSVTLTRCVDEDGVVRLLTDADEGITTFEAIGMCIYATDKMRKALNPDD